MIAKLKNLLARPVAIKPPQLPEGRRVYAIGDIHGRIDLLDGLIGLIETDDANRGDAHTTVVFLGDLIDRGLNSAAVLSRAREWAQRRNVEFVMGNHEEMALASRTNIEALSGFLKFGGVETIQSYGVSLNTIASADIYAVQSLLTAAIPQEDFEFLESFKAHVKIGDYLFVHAGIKPDVAIDRQLDQDCRWIREPFLSHDGDFGACVIHGHTISREPDVRANRIGIDTGGYLYGTLTAIGLEGEKRWFLQASDPEAPLANDSRNGANEEKVPGSL